MRNFVVLNRFSITILLVLACKFNFFFYYKVCFLNCDFFCLLFYLFFFLEVKKETNKFEGWEIFYRAYINFGRQILNIRRKKKHLEYWTELFFIQIRN